MQYFFEKQRWLGFLTFFTLPVLQRTFVNLFFQLAWGFGIEKWQGFLVNFQWSPFLRKQSTESPQILRGQFGAELCLRKLELRKPPPATEPFRALGARSPKRVKNESKKESPGPSGPRGPKSPKRARKESKTSQKGSFLTLFGLFLGLWGRRARETLF